MRYIRLHRHYYSIHAEWLGSICRRLSGNDGKSRLLDEDFVLLAVSFYLLKQDLGACPRNSQLMM